MVNFYIIKHRLFISIFHGMKRSDAVFFGLDRHGKGILIDSLTFIIQRRDLRLTCWPPLR